MSIIFTGSWPDLRKEETFTVNKATVKCLTGKYPPERIIEITHSDNSVKSFSAGFLNQEFNYLRLFVFDKMSDIFAAGCYLDRTSDFGTFKTVHVYPITAREEELRLAAPSLIPSIQNIVNSYLNFSEPG